MQPPGGVYLGLQQVEEEGQFLGPQHVMLEGIGLQVHRQNLTSVWRDQRAGSHQQLQRKTKIVLFSCGGDYRYTSICIQKTRTSQQTHCDVQKSNNKNANIGQYMFLQTSSEHIYLHRKPRFTGPASRLFYQKSFL